MVCNITLDRRRVKSDGAYPVIVKIKNKNTVRVATSLSCLEDEWSDEGMFSRKVNNSRRKNAILQKIKYDVEKVLLEIEESRKGISDTDLRNKILEVIKPKEKKEAPKNFLHYFDEFTATKTNERTKDVYLYTRSKIVEYDESCTFETIDLSWLRKFEAWMAKTMKVNAYAIHLRNIRAVFNYCLDEEYTTLYPFRRFKIKKEETRKRSLTVEQLRILRDYPCEEYQKKYRDIFMLMFYLIGINGADLFMAKPNQVRNGRLEYKRAKTGKLYSILIQPEAQEIIDRYRGKDYLINVMDEYRNHKDFLHRMGGALKDIGQMKRVGLGGKKIRNPLFPDISSYWSRHTWATIAAELDIPIDTISEALGHEHGCKTTQIYVNFNQKKVDKANRDVIDYVNKA